MGNAQEAWTAIEPKLEELRHLLKNLPGSVPSTGSNPEYPFANYAPNNYWIELTGSEEGALNHDLEIYFKDRSVNDDGYRIICFHEKGPSLTGIVDAIRL